MRKIILSAIFALCATFAIANDVTVVVADNAATKEAALNKALFNALEQQFGTYIEGNNDVLTAMSNLWGNIEKIKSYKIISITKTKDKYGAPQFTAKIEVIFDMDRNDEHGENQ